MRRVAHAVKTGSFNLVVGGQRGEAVSAEECWRHGIWSGFVLFGEEEEEEE